MTRFCWNEGALLGADCLFSQPFCQAKKVLKPDGTPGTAVVCVDLGRIPVQK
jgi:hypothetical protein